jgi:hypothetical protein
MVCGHPCFEGGLSGRDICFQPYFSRDSGSIISLSYVSALDICPLKNLTDHDGSEVNGRNIFKGPSELPKRRPNSTHHDHITFVHCPPLPFLRIFPALYFGYNDFDKVSTWNTNRKKRVDKKNWIGYKKKHWR